MFDGCYHGVHDYALMRADLKSDRSNPINATLGAGSRRDFNDLMMMLPIEIQMPMN